MAPDILQSPNRIPWPPILLVLALVLGRGGQALMPLGWEGAPAWVTVPGWALVVAGLALMLWSFLTFLLRKANILPHRAATALIETGPFALSRNPIYLSEATLLTGLALASGSLWWVLALGLFVAAVTRLAILPEEAHMAARFGSDWQAYASRVRRWI